VVAAANHQMASMKPDLTWFRFVCNFAVFRATFVHSRCLTDAELSQAFQVVFLSEKLKVF
jgi:hypothetical protein